MEVTGKAKQTYATSPQAQQNQNHPPLADNYAKQVEDFTAICHTLSNFAYTIKYEQRFQNRDPNQPLQSIMVKMEHSDGKPFSQEDWSKLHEFRGRLQDELGGKEDFSRLVSEHGSTPDGKFFLKLNLANLLDIRFNTLASKVNLTPERFNALKEYYLATAKSLGIAKEGKPSCALIENMTREECNQQLNSIVLISNLDDADKQCVAYQRDVYSIFPNRSDDRINQALLGTAGSAIRNGGNGSPYVAPDGQVSLLIRTTFADGVNGDQLIPVHVLSVSAPALDATHICPNRSIRAELEETLKARPEIATYIDMSTVPPKFLINNYITAFKNLSNHVIDAVEICKPERVVLCAFGCGAFLGSLEMIDKEYKTEHKKAAMEIIASSFAQLIMILREQGKEAAFTDFYYKSRDVWDRANQMLSLPELAPVFQVGEGVTGGSIGQGWGLSTDLFVNAWDPDAILGNKGEADQTADGQYGRRSTMPFVHFIASQNHNKTNRQPARQENCVMM